MRTGSQFRGQPSISRHKTCFGIQNASPKLSLTTKGDTRLGTSIFRSGADTNSGRDNGGFILFGTAKGYGFTWRPQKWFYPHPNPGHSYYDDPKRDLPTRFEQDDRIELDLTFPAPSAIRGTIVDGDGKPIPKTELAIWDAEKIPHDGYGPGQPGSDRRPFAVMDNDGFGLLNADVPTQMWKTHTDAEGKFEFTDVPSGRRFRVNVQPPGFPSRMVWFTTQTGMDENYDEFRLYDASKDIRLTFQTTLEVPIQVVCADTGKPAPDVFVSAGNEMAGVSKTTDREGRVSLALPPGDYRLHIIRAYGTPYLEADSDFALGNEAPLTAIVAQLPAAAQIEVLVIDKETGKGIENVDLWREESAGRRELHFTTGWEAATRIVHRDRVRTDTNGTIRAYSHQENIELESPG